MKTKRALIVAGALCLAVLLPIQGWGEKSLKKAQKDVDQANEKLGAEKKEHRGNPLAKDVKVAKERAADKREIRDGILKKGKKR
ncbi:MAG: hypothetical protein ACOYOS_14755 [Syntrophales bacterium]